MDAVDKKAASHEAGSFQDDAISHSDLAMEPPPSAIRIPTARG